MINCVRISLKESTHDRVVASRVYDTGLPEYIYLLGISGVGIDADSQVEKPMRLQVKE